MFSPIGDLGYSKTARAGTFYNSRILKYCRKFGIVKPVRRIISLQSMRQVVSGLTCKKPVSHSPAKGPVRRIDVLGLHFDGHFFEVFYGKLHAVDERTNVSVYP